MKNDESLLSQKILKLKSESRTLLTGTPLQNNLQELYNLHLQIPSVCCSVARAAR